MPPLHDNIVDALELVADGSTQTVSLDNTGATFETNELAETEPQEGVWAKIDLSSYPAFPVDIPVDLVRTGGGASFAPEFAVFRVNDASFDPSSPDFTKLSYLSSANRYIGDGTTDPPEQTISILGGLGSNTDQSETGVFYLVFNDYNYAEYGSADVSYAIPLPPPCIDAVDVINPDSPTASVVSGRVREDNTLFTDYSGAPSQNIPEKTLKWTWTGPAGQYQVQALGQPSSGGQAFSNTLVSIVIMVNGRCFFRPINHGFTSAASDSWFVHNGYGFGVSDTEYEASDYSINPWIPLKPGDLVEVMVVSAMKDISNVMIPFELESLCFFPDSNAPATSGCTPSILFDPKPLGDEWGSYRGWGGQKLVPDQIWTELGITAYDDSPGNFAWGVNFSDFDFCVTPDGVVYVIYMDEMPGSAAVGAHHHVGAFANAETGYYFMVVKKYDPAAGDWVQVATLNKFDPIDGTGHAVGCLAGPHQAESANAYYDPIGGFVYFAWVEASFYYTNFPDLDQKAYVAKLDPSDDSWTYLGDGVQALAHANLGNYDRFSTLGVDIAVTTNGDVYIGTVEITTATEPSDPKGKPFVWRWDGSTWTNLNLPDPSDLPDSNWDVIGENQFWDQLVMVVPYRRDGSQDGITVYFVYLNNTSAARKSCTIEYTPGGGWDLEVLTAWSDVEGTYPPLKRSNAEGASAGDGFGITPVDPTVLWSETLGRLVLVQDFLSSGEEIWDMFKMNDAGDQWELLEPTSVAPPSSAGPWRQTRNSAAIGPDGEIYRATFSDHFDSDFWPWVVKHSPGYGYGYADACVKHIGESVTTDAQGNDWEGVFASMEATANHRIRWQGNNVYVICSLFTEPFNVNDIPEDDGDSPSADGVFIFKGTYVPCETFVPHIYRRIFG
jgi:hypothetical protein